MTAQYRSGFGVPRRVWRRLAVALGVLMLGAQLLALAHVHRYAAATHTVATAAQAGAIDGLCALCLFHFDSPAGTASSPLLARPVLGEPRAGAAAAPRLCSAPDGYFSRAPPVAS